MWLMSYYRSSLLLCIAVALTLSSCTGRHDRYAQMLEEAEWMNRNDSLFTSDSIGLALVRHYDHWWHSPNHRMRAYYMLGCAYRDMGNAPRALENYQHVVALGEGDATTTTLDLLMRVHSQMSELYLHQRLPELEEYELKMAEKLAWQISDTLSALYFKSGLCHLLFVSEQYDECIKQAKVLHQNLLNCGYKDEALQSYVFLVKSYLQKKDYEATKGYLKLYESCSYFKTAPNRIIGGLSALYIYKGQYFLGMENIDSAEVYFQKAASHLQKGSSELLIYKGLSGVYSLKNDADSVLKYTRLYSEAKERNFNNDITQATLQAKNLYDYNVEQRIAKEKTEEATRLTIWLIAFFLICMLLINLIIYQHKKKEKKIIALFQKFQTAIQQLEETKEELTSVMQERDSSSEHIEQLRNNIVDKEKQIQELEIAIRERDMRRKSISLNDTDIVKRFLSIRMQGKFNQITDNDWEQLRKTVEQIYPNFSKHMNSHQQLNDSEYKVCMLMVSGFTPTDIDALMGKSNSFSSMTRKRLCVKVLGIGGKPSDFDHWLYKLYS